MKFLLVVLSVLAANSLAFAAVDESALIYGNSAVTVIRNLVESKYTGCRQGLAFGTCTSPKGDFNISTQLCKFKVVEECKEAVTAVDGQFTRSSDNFDSNFSDRIEDISVTGAVIIDK